MAGVMETPLLDLDDICGDLTVTVIMNVWNDSAKISNLLEHLFV